MIKGLVLADDVTGALDAGVKFSDAGLKTKVSLLPKIEETDTGASVLVLCVPTRHETPETAYRQVRALSARAAEKHIGCIFKKTDSALRGNVGAELTAVLDGSGEHELFFIPALPAMNRVTINGIHYINGVPVHESVFGDDTFEPVTESYIPALLETQLSPQGEYLLASEAASAGMVLMSRCQLAAPGQAEATLAHLNRALEACHCARRFAADTDALCKPWDALTDADMQRLDSCGHCQASYVKLHFDEHKAFPSLYFMELHLTLPQCQDAARALFADPACGHILRIKGFLQTVDGWCELNATRDTMHVEAIPDGQEVLIIIGEELDRSAIEAHIGQKTADQE